MPPHIERASASREKKPPPPPIAKPVAVPPFVPYYTGMQTAIRTRVDEFGITREQLDFLTGNQSGYSGKVLGPKQVKEFGKQSLGSTVGGLGYYFALVDDPEQSEKLRIVADALSTVSAATKSACPPRQPRASPAGNSSK
jgi:hypothetical protein